MESEKAEYHLQREKHYCVLGSRTFFSVLLENKVKQRKKRILIIDEEQGTLSRITVSNKACVNSVVGTNISNHEETEFESGLRKTVPITPIMLVQQSDSNQCKLHLYVSPETRPYIILFPISSCREHFCAIVRKIRNKAARIEENRVRTRIGCCQKRLSIYTTTWNAGNATVASFLQSSQYYTFNQGEWDDPAFANIISETHNKQQNLSNNTNKLSATDILNRWIPTQEHDVYVICLQECRSRDFLEWQRLFHKHLNNMLTTETDTDTSNMKEDFKLLCSVSMWSIHCICLVRASVSDKFFNIRTDNVARGFGGKLANKGAVGLSFEYGEGTAFNSISFGFISSHLAARAERILQRREDYAEISRSLLSKSKGCFEGVQLVHTVDHLFWLGDLNYRVDLGNHGKVNEYNRVLDILRKDDFREKLEHADQLVLEKQQDNVFFGFKEGKITFRPTYRMEVGKLRSYSNKKNQCPSWTDRVLFTSKPGREHHIKQTSYDAQELMMLSDHRPVTATFTVSTSLNSATFQEQFRTCQGKETESVYGSSFFENKFQRKLQRAKHHCENSNPEISFVKLKFVVGEQEANYRRFDNNSRVRNSDACFEQEMNNAFGISTHCTGSDTVIDLSCLNKNEEIQRYLSHGHKVSTSWGKLFVQVQAPFVDQTPISSGTRGKGLEIALPDTDTKMDSHRLLQYEWNSNDLPVVVPFVSDTSFLRQRGLVVTIRRKNNLPLASHNVIGSAVVPLQGICKSPPGTNTCFQIPVIRNGQPAGILYGEIIARGLKQDDHFIVSKKHDESEVYVARNKIIEKDQTQNKTMELNKKSTHPRGEHGDFNEDEVLIEFSKQCRSIGNLILNKALSFSEGT